MRRSTWVAWSLLATWTASAAALVALAAANGTFQPDAFTDSLPLLLAVVDQTVQPTSATLWLQPSPGPPGRPPRAATLPP